MRRYWVALLAGAVLATIGGVTLLPRTGSSQTRAAKPAKDLEVTIILATGAEVTYRKRLRRFEIILDASGRINTLHLVLAMSGEKDTHAWYNFDKIAGFRHRYYSITGRAKVRVRRLFGYPVREEAKRKQQKLEAIGPEHFR